MELNLSACVPLGDVAGGLQEPFHLVGCQRNAPDHIVQFLLSDKGIGQIFTHLYVGHALQIAHGQVADALGQVDPQAFFRIKIGERRDRRFDA